MRRKIVILFVATLTALFGAGACGSQEEVDTAKQDVKEAEQKVEEAEQEVKVKEEEQEVKEQQQEEKQTKEEVPKEDAAPDER